MLDKIEIQKIVHERMSAMMEEIFDGNKPDFILLVPETGMLVTSLNVTAAALALSSCVTSLLSINYNAVVTSEEDENGNIEASTVGMN